MKEITLVRTDKEDKGDELLGYQKITIIETFMQTDVICGIELPNLRYR